MGATMFSKLEGTASHSGVAPRGRHYWWGASAPHWEVIPPGEENNVIRKVVLLDVADEGLWLWCSILVYTVH